METSLLFLCKLLLITVNTDSIINTRRAGRFPSKSGQLQPVLFSLLFQFIFQAATVKWSIQAMRLILDVRTCQTQR